MTPAVNFLKKHGIAHTLHTYHLTGDDNNYGQAVANTLNVPHPQLFKTLIVCLNGQPKQLGVCIIPVVNTLNLKAAASAFGAKSAALAETRIAQQTTGYVVGGISPFGQKKRLPVVLDNSAVQFETLFVSGGKRGLQVEVPPKAMLEHLSSKLASLTD